MSDTPLFDMTTMRRMYDSRPLTAIEKTARDYQSIEVDAHRHLISVLSYLEHTRRYREDPAFSTSDFDKYLRSRFDMAYTRYSEGKTAYIRYPDLTTTYGVGFVTDAARRCGLDRMDDLAFAIREYDISEADLSAADLETLVAIYAKPKEKQKRTDWKSKYLALAEETNVLRSEMDEKDAEIVRLREELATARSARAFLKTVDPSARDYLPTPPIFPRLSRGRRPFRRPMSPPVITIPVTSE